jgi:hypothetical protein
LNFSEIVLDCRELEAPEPMNLVLTKLSICDINTYIKMIHRIEPVPLLSLLQSNNFSSKTIKEKNDFIIYIWLNNQKELTKHIKGL